jgi:hypothetical protein
MSSFKWESFWELKFWNVLNLWSKNVIINNQIEPKYIIRKVFQSKFKNRTCIFHSMLWAINYITKKMLKIKLIVWFLSIKSHLEKRSHDLWLKHAPCHWKYLVKNYNLAANLSFSIKTHTKELWSHKVIGFMIWKIWIL